MISLGHKSMIQRRYADWLGCSGVFSAICFCFIVGVIACHASTRDTSISKSTTPGENKSTKSGKAIKNSAGWIVTLNTKRFGLSRYYLSDTTLKVESSMLVVFVDARSKNITLGTWETKKRFTFPVEKSRFYTKLMGISAPKTDSAFSREFQQTPWKQTRTLKIGEMDAVEYERHVLNPPRGRTRSQIQIIGHLDHVSPRLLAYYHQLQNSIPTASCDGFLLEDKVIITNPSQGWEDFSPKNAVRAVLPPDKTCFPDGFQKVSSASELFLDDRQDVSQSDGHLKKSMHSRLKQQLKEQNIID
jgi:hypothetical protein